MRIQNRRVRRAGAKYRWTQYHWLQAERAIRWGNHWQGLLVRASTGEIDVGSAWWP